MKIELFRPHKSQREVLDAINDEQLKYIVLNCGRRWGKSELALNLIVEFGLKYPNSNILYITFKGDQRLTAFQDFLRLFGDAPFIDKSNRNNFDIFLKSGSKINFRLATYPSIEGIRGKRFNLIILDEFSLYRVNVWESIIQPTLATRNDFKVLFMSTPRGKGLFYNLYLRGLDSNSKSWKSFHLPSSANPLVNKEFLEETKKEIPDKIFKQEYLAEFQSESGVLFENIISNISTQEHHFTRGKSYYAGIDIGFQNDYTVCSVIDEEGSLVDWLRFNECTMEDAAERLTNMLKKWNWPYTNIENNNYQGLSAIMELMGAKMLNQHFTTSTNKKEMIEHLIHLFQTNAIKIINDKTLIQELSDFNYFYNPKTRNIYYSAPDGIHDDTVMSLGLAHYSRKKNLLENSFSFGFAR